jgi:uncharacterized membrane protein
MDLAYIASVIGGFIGIILLVTTYMYIDKLEKIGCPCADHPYRNFIKKYCIFAIVFLLVTMFFPASSAVQLLGPIGATAYMFVKVAYVIATVIFFVLALIYVRYLMKEKCKCSEDIRREVLYIWAILEIVILGALVVIPLIITIIGGALGVVLGGVKSVHNSAAQVQNIAVNPLKSVKKVPGALRDSAKAAKNLLRRK